MEMTVVIYLDTYLNDGLIDLPVVGGMKIWFQICAEKNDQICHWF